MDERIPIFVPMNFRCFSYNLSTFHVWGFVFLSFASFAPCGLAHLRSSTACGDPQWFSIGCLSVNCVLPVHSKIGQTILGVFLFFLGNVYGEFMEIIGLKTPFCFLPHSGLITFRFYYVRNRNLRCSWFLFVWTRRTPYLWIWIYQITSKHIRTIWEHFSITLL